MKKLLAAAAATAILLVMPIAPALAGDAPAIKPVCLVLPLLLDCLGAWQEMHSYMMAMPAKMGDMRAMMPAKIAAAVPAPMIMPMMWGCRAAPAESGHLFDCSM